MDAHVGLLRVRVALRGLIASLEASAQLATATPTDTLPPSWVEVARKAPVRFALVRQAFEEAQARSRDEREQLAAMHDAFERLERCFHTFEAAAGKPNAAALTAEIVQVRSSWQAWQG